MDKIQDTFEKMGGEFVSSPFFIKEKLHHIKAIVCDWDGVFHSAYKDESGSSLFSECDSMGMNMLRFGLYLEHDKNIPFTAIITGENNKTAFHWGKREHLEGVFFKIKNKVELLPYLKEEFGISPGEILFVFDDILDLSLAKECGLRMLITKKANPYFIQYCIKQKLCDYVTGCSGEEHAIREVSELCLNLLGRFEETIDKRMEFNGDYQPYIQGRNEIETKICTLKEGKVVEAQ